MSEVSDSRRRGRSARGEGAELRGELLAAAHDIVRAGGTADEVTVRAVAERVGVAQGSIYLHFRSRDELVYHLAFEHFGEHNARLVESLQAVGDPRKRIELRGRSYVEYALTYPSIFHPLLMGTGRETTPDRFDGYELISRTNMGGMVDDVRAAIAAGSIRPQHPETLTCLLWMSMHGLVSLLISVPDFPWPPRPYLVDQMLTLVREGMGPTPTPLNSSRPPTLKSPPHLEPRPARRAE